MTTESVLEKLKRYYMLDAKPDLSDDDYMEYLKLRKWYQTDFEKIIIAALDWLEQEEASTLETSKVEYIRGYLCGKRKVFREFKAILKGEK